MGKNEGNEMTGMERGEPSRSEWNTSHDYPIKNKKISFSGGFQRPGVDSKKTTEDE